MEKKRVLRVPAGRLGDDDAAAAARKKILEELKNDKPVRVTPSGQVVSEDDPTVDKQHTLQAAPGKLAGMR